jgi:hypothetical protein
MFALPHTTPIISTIDINGAKVEVAEVPPGTDMLTITGFDMWVDCFSTSVKTVGLHQLPLSSHKPLRLGLKPEVVQPTDTKHQVITNFGFVANKLRNATHAVIIEERVCYVRTFPHETTRMVEIDGRECEVLFFSREPIESN